MMGRNRATLLVAAALMLGRTAAAAPPGVVVDDKPITDVQDIEDVGLAGLLNLDLEDQLGTTTAVSRTSESLLRAAATVSSIDSFEARLSGARTLPELLRFVPGVQVSRNAAGNHLVAVRGTAGITGNNLVVLLDGVPLNSPVDASVDWDLVPITPFDVERIEVVRGPVSSIYGANAYAGVVNIVTHDTVSGRHVVAVRGLGGGDSAGGTTGDAGFRFIHNRGWLKLKWLANATRDDVLQAGDGGASSPPRISVSSSGSLIATLRGQHTFALQGGVSGSRRSSLDQLVIESNPQERGLAFLSARYEASGLPGLFDTIAAWTRGRVLAIRTDDTQYRGFHYGDTDAAEGGAGLDLAFDIRKNLKATLGTEAILNGVDAPYIHPAENAKLRVGYGLYAGASYFPTDSLDLQLSVRGDRSPVMARLTPSFRLSAVYHAASWAVRAAAGSAFRSPSYVEAAGRFVSPSSGLILLEGSPDVAAPRNQALEIGATIAPLTTLRVSPTVYLSRLENTVAHDFEPLVRKTFVNDPAARLLLGAEIEGSWEAGDGLKLIPSASYIRFLRHDRGLVPTVGIPEQNATFIAGLRAHGTFLNERWGYGVRGMVASPRRYRVLAGIPPQILDRRVPTTGYVSGTVEHKVWLRMPFWLSLRVESHLPHDAVESPFPQAVSGGTSALIGLEYRTE